MDGNKDIEKGIAIKFQGKGTHGMAHNKKIHLGNGRHQEERNEVARS
jgi:hypothetical protein